MSFNELRKGRVSQVGRIYHLTLVTQNRAPLFGNLQAGRKLVRELMRLQADGMTETICYVIMPDHLHWLMELHAGSLAEAVKLLKGRTAHARPGDLADELP